MPRRKSIINMEHFLGLYSRRRAVTGNEELDSVAGHRLRRKVFSGRRYLDESHSGRLKFLRDFEKLEKSGKIPFERVQEMDQGQRDEQVVSLILHQIKKARARTVMQAIAVLQRDISAIRKRNTALSVQVQAKLKNDSKWPERYRKYADLRHSINNFCNGLEAELGYLQAAISTTRKRLQEK